MSQRKWNPAWGREPKKQERPPAWTRRQQVQRFDDLPDGGPPRVTRCRDVLPDVLHEVACRTEDCPNAAGVRVAGPVNENLICAKCGHKLYWNGPQEVGGETAERDVAEPSGLPGVGPGGLVPTEGERGPEAGPATSGV